MLLSLLAAFLGGLLLFVSQPPRRVPEWQFLALALLGGATINASSLLEQAAIGALFGAAYVVPTLYHLRLLPIVAAGLGTLQTLEWALIAMGTARLLSWQPVAGAFAGAAFATAIAWLDVSLLPLWGTAQSWTRPWSHRPRRVQFACLTGWSGSVFFVTAPAFLVVSVLRPSQMVWPLIALCLFIMGTLLLNELLWRNQSAETVRVAAIGWHSSDFDSLEWKQVAFQATLEKAVEDGAKLIVTPEGGFSLENREPWRLAVCALAVQHRVAFAIGYMDIHRLQNCIDFVSEKGEVLGRYLKTHLVPIFESYNAGIGKRSPVEMAGTKLGGVICQDDNFTDIARGYGRDEVKLLTVPTHDWREVKEFHLTSTLWRAIENRYAIARSASNGISALISARGEVIARSDHYQDGLKVLVHDLPLGTGKTTFYARYGDWFPVFCGLFALGCLLMCAEF